jgi:endonuclease/exonuclease/phosphatase (EEP) superfamily protein YafD
VSRAGWRPALLVAAALPVAGLALAALAPTGWWVASLAMHWAPQLALLALPFWCWRGRNWKIGLGMLLLAGAALWPSLGAAFAEQTPAPSSGITVTTANIYFRSARHAEAIARLDGELVALIETRPEDHALVMADPRWPHQHWQRSRKVAGMALLSAFPMQAKSIELDRCYGIDARVEMPWGTQRVIALHTWSPTTPDHIAGNHRQLAELAGLAATEPGPLLVLGDLNSTPGTPGMRLLRSTGLRPPHGGEVRTWPSQLGPFGIAIDHVLARGLALGDATAIDLPGSDHHAVRVRVAGGAAGAARQDATRAPTATSPP